MTRQTSPCRPAALWLALGVFLVEGSALAQSSQTTQPISPVDEGQGGYPYRPPPPPPPPPPPKPDRETISRNYMQMSMGFVGGGRRYADSSFESTNGVAPNLSEVFIRQPFESETVLGLRYDLRAVFSYVRGTIGVDFPFSTFRGRDAMGTYVLDGKTVNVAVQSVRPYELRFGIGAEYPVWVFAPFADLIGYAYWTNVGLAVDDTKAEYQAKGFGFDARAGVRVHAKPWFFVQAAADIGIYGPVRWNAELSIGFAAPTKRW